MTNKSMIPFRVGLQWLLTMAALCLCRGEALAGTFRTAYWAWRGESLSQTDAGELGRCGVQTLFWRVGELTDNGTQWIWSGQCGPVSGGSNVLVVPVVRLVSGSPSPFSGESVGQLLEMLPPEANRAGELQIDFDCPDRLLGEYAAALAQLRRRVPHLSAMALAGWCHSPAWLQLQGSVDELFPMFYDLQADPPIGARNPPPPLLDPSKVARQLQEWRRCKIPWQAGLPTFARVTFYNSEGHSLGHLPGWTWDDLCFDPVLMTSGSTEQGVTLFRAAKAGSLENAAMREGETVAVRWPDREALRDTIDAAKVAGAKGVVFFRLPDANDPSGWSVSQVTHLQAEPDLALRKCGADCLELVNDADGDLAPRLSGTAALDRGYALELDAPGPIFREALEGNFWRVTGHADPDTHPRAVPIPLATRLTFWLSHLRAHESLRTGLIQLAPGADLGQIRYRIVPGITEWHFIP